MMKQYCRSWIIPVILILISPPTIFLVRSWLVEIANNGTDSNKCLSGNGSPPCQTLDYIANCILPKENITIIIASPQLVLSDTLIIHDTFNFTLLGTEESPSIIKCEQEASGGSGFQFINVSGIIIRNIKIETCNALYDKWFYSSLHVGYSTDVIVNNVTINGSLGYGLSLVNTRGSVLIENSTFQDNGQNTMASRYIRGGSGGLLITVDSRSHNWQFYTANYFISDCRFLRNVANLTEPRWHSVVNHGGGMFIFLSNGAQNNTFTVTECVFRENKALFGAGLYIKCSKYCERNIIKFSNCRFEQNNATRGGGAMDIGFSVYENHCKKEDIEYRKIPKNNLIMFHKCDIFNNTGLFGGGVAIFSGSANSIPSGNDKQNTIRFNASNFTENMANGGAAVDINYASVDCDYLFMVFSFFSNCNFYNNTAGTSGNTSSKITQSGTFFTSKIIAFFEGKINFENNVGSALYASSTSVYFENVDVYFGNNTGEPSGGIVLVSQSNLKLFGRNTFNFKNNQGTFGAAICFLILETHYFQYTDKCFISSNDSNDTFTEFNFVNNTATTGIAHDLFVTNLIPCQPYPDSKQPTCNNDSLKTKDCSVAFNFNSSSNQSRYATATQEIVFVPNKTHVKPIPGLPIRLGILQIDQFKQDVGKLFPLSAAIKKKSNSKITIDDNYAFVTQNTVILNGEPGDTATLVLQSNIIAVVMISLSIEMSYCPPGFKLNETTKACYCRASRFISPWTRNTSGIKQGIWAGYMNNKSMVFAIGNCEYRLCQYDRSKLAFGSYELPTQPEQLENFVCGDQRYGRLCGKCKENYTVYYNSPTFKCEKIKDRCVYGPLLYFILEIVPITVLFLIIIIFNIHLTSGSLYSFIFFAQALDILYVDAFGAVQFKGAQKKILDGLRILYSFTNLKFFQIEHLSICLLKEKQLTALDIFIAEYIPLIYALLLIFVTLLILKVNSLYTCIRLCHKCGRRNIRGSVINGLTAFVVLCYFKCVDLTYSILIPVTIYVDEKPNKTVPLFNGELDYMDDEHLKYTVPAFICLIVLILPPPVLLLFESIAMSINRSCRIRRNCFTYFLHRIRMKAMPFIDSFQGCFKDDRRCFAGLFFAYKVLLLSPYLYTANILYDYVTVEIILCGILVLHIYFRPFQKSWYNVLDALLLVNLILINLLTITRYSTVSLSHEYITLSLLFISLQVFCIALPLLSVGVLVIIKIFMRYNLHVLLKNRLRVIVEHSKVPRAVSEVFKSSTTAAPDSLTATESLPFRLVDSNYYNAFDDTSSDN